MLTWHILILRQLGAAMLYCMSEAQAVQMVWLLIGEILLQEPKSMVALPFCTFWDSDFTSHAVPLFVAVPRSRERQCS